MNNRDIDKSLKLIAYGNFLLERVDNLLKEIEKRTANDSALDIIDHNVFLENSYDSVCKYHEYTQRKLEELLTFIIELQDSIAKQYIINHIEIAKKHVVLFQIETLNAKSKYIKFDIRSYFKAVTNYIVRELSESAEYLYLHYIEEQGVRETVDMCLRCMEALGVYTITCKSGDEWNEMLFDLEQYESGNITSDIHLVDRVYKVYKKAYLINYDNTSYKIASGLVSVWRIKEVDVAIERMENMP